MVHTASTACCSVPTRHRLSASAPAGTLPSETLSVAQSKTDLGRSSRQPSCIRCVTTMRSINLHFTYLLTYVVRNVGLHLDSTCAVDETARGQSGGGLLLPATPSASDTTIIIIIIIIETEVTTAVRLVLAVVFSRLDCCNSVLAAHHQSTTARSTERHGTSDVELRLTDHLTSSLLQIVIDSLASSI